MDLVMDKGSNSNGRGEEKRGAKDLWEWIEGLF
jgi:hypothetical protein